MSANSINVRATKEVKIIKDTDYIIVGVEGKEPPKKIKLKDFILLITSSSKGTMAPEEPRDE